MLNVGAGAGSHEPTDVAVVAVEPAEVMLAQRRALAAPAVRAITEELPSGDAAFGAGMAILTVHHWSDITTGLSELRREVGGPVVVLTWDVAVGDNFWTVAEYLPASLTLDRDLPSPEEMADLLGGGTIDVIPVPADCTDGFSAWRRRPDAYLDAGVRVAISCLARLPTDDLLPGIRRLENDLASGEWYRRHADLLTLDELDAGIRLVVSGATV